MSDRYQHLGERMRMGSYDACVAAARRWYPHCSFEGSTGPERSIWSHGSHVGHCWPVNSDWNGQWFMRLKGIVQ
jgi:hypothetical protein